MSSGYFVAVTRQRRNTSRSDTTSCMQDTTSSKRTQPNKKSHSPCAYAIFLLPLRSNLLHRSYYENNHHYPSSNYGTQILSSMWCRVYLPTRKSRSVPMCRRGTLSCYSCASSSAIPQPMPLPQVPHRIRRIELTHNEHLYKLTERHQRVALFSSRNSLFGQS